MKKKFKKIVGFAMAVCMTLTAMSVLFINLANYLKKNDSYVSTSALATSYTTYSDSFNKSNYTYSANSLSKILISDNVASDVTLSYNTQILDNINSNTGVELIEQISNMGTIEEYLRVNDVVYGNLEYDEDRKLISNTINYNNIYYEYDGTTISEFVNNSDLYLYTYNDEKLTSVLLNNEEFANYTYGENGTINKEEYPTLNKLYEHTNTATMEYAYNKELDAKILIKIYDHLANNTYTITKSNVTNNEKVYSVITKIECDAEWLEFEYDYFYNNIAYITKVKSANEEYYLSYLNDKIISKTTEDSKITFIYSSSGELIGLMSGKVINDEYNEGFVSLVKDPFGNVIEANYIDLKKENEESCYLELKKVYDQQFNCYGNKIFVNNYDANLGINIGYKGGISFDELNLVYINGNLYSTKSADFILNQTNATFNYGLIEQNIKTRQDPLFSTVEKSVATESIQKEISLQYQTSSVSGLQLYSNEFCVGIANIFTLPVDLDPDNMLKLPSTFAFVANKDNQMEVDYYKNLVSKSLKPDDNVCVLFDNYYMASLFNQPIKLQFVFNNCLYSVEAVDDGIFGYTKKENYSKADFIEKANIINYDTGRYLTYHKSTLNSDDYIDDISFLTNISSTKDLDNYFKDIGLISSSVGQTYANVNFGDNQEFMENLLKNTCNLNLPEYNPDKEYLTINESGEYVVNTIPEDASVEETPFRKDYTLIRQGVMYLLTGISLIINGVLLVVSCGTWAIVCGVVALASGVVVAVCGIGAIAEGATGESWIVDNIFGGDIELLHTVASIASTVGTIASIIGSITFKSCFVEGTQVATINGNKNIENIKAGDYVLAYNALTNEQSYSKVLNTYKSQTNTLCEITYGNTKITSTPNHPYFVEGQWVEAEDLKQGDILTLSNNKKVEVSSVKSVDCETTNVYNLNVDTAHTYYANDVLVHNTCDPAKFTTDQTDELFKSKEYQSAVKQMKAKYPKVDFDDYSQATKFWNKHRSEFNKILGRKIANNASLKNIVPNWEKMVSKGVNPLIKVTSGGKTALLKVNYHHISGKLNSFDIYPMIRGNHIQYHNIFGRFPKDQYKWKPFADYVQSMVKGIK